MKGIIKITDKVRFVYYELPEPDENSELLSLEEFEQACENYYNSKREMEVENVGETSKGRWEAFRWEWDSVLTTWSITWMELKNDLPCETEITEHFKYRTDKSTGEHIREKVSKALITKII